MVQKEDTSRRSSLKQMLPSAKLQQSPIIGKSKDRSERLTQTIDAESHHSNLNRTFEILIGGQTGASIYFDPSHAEHEEQKEFDRLFGARQGRKFRIGHSVEVSNSRTMD